VDQVQKWSEVKLVETWKLLTKHTRKITWIRLGKTTKIWIDQFKCLRRSMEKIILLQLLIDFNLSMDLLHSVANLMLKMIILNKLSKKALLRLTESLKKHLKEPLNNNSFLLNQNSLCHLLLQWRWAPVLLRLSKNLGMLALIKQAEFELLRVRANRTQTTTWFLN